MIFLGYRKTNTIHKKICVKTERGGKNNQDSNEQNSTSLLLSSACHNTDIVCVCGDGRLSAVCGAYAPASVWQAEYL